MKNSDYKKGLESIISHIGSLEKELKETNKDLKHIEWTCGNQLEQINRLKDDLTIERDRAAILRKKSEMNQNQNQVLQDMIAKKNNECKDLEYGTALLKKRIEKLENENKRLKAKKK